jgi:CubicO group peptidase (beta-lactamase class C family)
LIAKYHVAGLGAGVMRGGKLVWTGFYGEQGPGIKATAATLFNVASMAKPITAETIVRAAAAGQLSLDQPMAPTWVDPDIASDRRHLALTPRIALSHRTGFPNWRRMNRGGKLAFLVDPGTRFGYSGEGFNYVARFAEKKTGETLEALADKYVFRPMGMTQTSYSQRGWMTGRVATPMDTTGHWGKPDLHPAGHWSAADDIYTTVADYAGFLSGVMSGQGLTAEQAADRFRAEVDISPEWPCVAKPADRCPDHASYALGWFRFDYGADPVIWHGGDDWGEHSIAYFYPKTRDGVIVLVNGGNGRYAVIDAVDLLDDHSPIPAFAKAHRSPIGGWLRALLDAAYAGTLPGQKPRT